MSSGEITEMFSYTVGGRMTAKRLRLTRSNCLADLDAAFSYDNKGRLTQVNYPGAYAWNPYPTQYWYWQAGPAFLYSYDSLGRPNALTRTEDGTSLPWVTDVTYGPAGQLTGMRFVAERWNDYGDNWYSTWYQETRTYNARLQLTQVTNTGSYDWMGHTPVSSNLEYRYSASQNNGRITQMKDWLSGEEVTYSYDALNRLIAAVTTGPEWGLSFGYDGFGNLTAETPTKGSAPSLNLGYNPATNRINGYSYDLNGNLLSMPFVTMSYDTENRLSQATHTDNGTETHAYNPANQRVWWRSSSGAETVQMYGPNGERLASYGLNPVEGYGGLRFTYGSYEVYFAGRRIWSGGLMGSGGVVEDRLGTAVVYGGIRRSYYPYGEARTGAAVWATYTRTSAGLDYASQRYYASQVRRFLTADPYVASEGPADPQSWNRSVYTQGDPVNFNDPSKLFRAMSEGPPEMACIMYGIHVPEAICTLIFGAGGGVGRGPVEPPDPGGLGGSGSQTMDLSQRGLDCIKSYEGLSLTVYKDSAGNDTIGYGHLIRPGEDFSAGITEQQAADLLRKDASHAINAVRDLMKVDLEQNQFDALVSFIFNVGRLNFAQSTLLSNINSGKPVHRSELHRLEQGWW